MITHIEPRGLLVADCGLPGESKADDVFPAHPSAIPLSRDRWLILFSTRGYQGIDDERSIVYQIREATPAGRVLREGWIARSLFDWDPFGRGERLHKEHGHPVAFGVPKGAVTAGGNANVFVVKWRTVGKTVAADGQIASPKESRVTETQDVEWLQCRLNDADDDLEILQPARSMGRRGMNQTFVAAVPFNADGTEWADVNHFHRQIAALKYRFNPTTRLYEWVETGPLAGTDECGLFEASLLRGDGDWIIAARKHFATKENGVAWLRTVDPFRQLPAPICPTVPASYAPVTAYRCADGVIRIFTGDPTLSQSPRGGRNPLRCWDINPVDFAATNMRVVFDTYDAGLPMREACGPIVDMCKLLPHAGGRVQYLVFRVRAKAINRPANTKAVVNAEEKACSGIYHALIHYEQEWPGCWQFAR